MTTAAQTSRENATAKAHRLLAEGRLTVRRLEERITGRYVYATCKGDHGELYDLGFDPSTNEWRCNCEARSRCSHLIALQLVTVVRP